MRVPIARLTSVKPGRPKGVASMTCSEFLQSFSEYYDGTGSESLCRGAEEHLAGCADCRRYLETFNRGRSLLRSFPEIEVSDDFHPRLQHRIYHLEDGEVLKRGMLGSASGTTAVTALGMAILLVFAAWSPTLLTLEPVVTLSPIVVSGPDMRSFGLRLRPLDLEPEDASPLDEGRNLWQHPNALLFRHSPLSGRSRPAFRRTDLE